MTQLLKKVQQFRHLGAIVVIALLAFVPTLGAVHLFDWDEINFAESAREMIVTGDYFRVQVNFAPFWEKPPLFFWLQAISMQLFGVNEFAARFPNAMIGVATLIVLYFLGKKEKGERFGAVWSLLYLCSFLPQVYFRSAIIDPLFNLFIFLSAYHLFKALSEQGKENRRSIWSGLFCGLAILTKGPVGLLLVALTWATYLVARKFKNRLRFKQIGLFALMVVTVTFPWFGVELIVNGPWFLVEFIHYQMELFSRPVAGHQQPFFYHFIVVFWGTFPLSVFALPSLIKKRRATEMERWWTILFWVVLLLFSVVSTKIVHYSSMTYLPLSFLAAVVIEQTNWKETKKWVKGMYCFLAILFFILFLTVPLLGLFNTFFLPYINDPFAVAGWANPEVSWSGWEPLIALFYLSGVVVFVAVWRKGKLLSALKYKAILFSLTLSLTFLVTVQKIEMYSQGPLIAFLKALKGKEVYVTSVGFKSYAPYFYFEQTREVNASEKIRSEKFNGEKVAGGSLQSAVNDFLVHGAIDREAYFITKIHHEELDTLPHIEKLYEKGGFKFYRRRVDDALR